VPWPGKKYGPYLREEGRKEGRGKEGGREGRKKEGKKICASFAVGRQTSKSWLLCMEMLGEVERHDILGSGPTCHFSHSLGVVECIPHEKGHHCTVI
jgi:hypothetical protein